MVYHESILIAGLSPRLTRRMLQGETWEVWQFAHGVGGMCFRMWDPMCFQGPTAYPKYPRDPSMIPSQESALHCIEEDLSMKPRTGKQLPGIHATLRAEVGKPLANLELELAIECCTSQTAFNIYIYTIHILILQGFFHCVSCFFGFSS